MNKHVQTDLLADVEAKAPVVGTVIDNGKELLLIPEAELKKIDAMAEKLSAEPAEREFDWANDESVLIREQPETAVYWNKYNDLVIRQNSWPDDDACVRISQNNLMTFIDKLCDLAGIPSAGK